MPLYMKLYTQFPRLDAPGTTQREESGKFLYNYHASNNFKNSAFAVEFIK